MNLIKVRDTAGFLDDLEPEDLPLNAITEGQNFTLKEGYAGSSNGHESIWGTPPVTPYWCMEFKDGSTVYWIYTSLAKAYRVNSSGSDTDITRYTTTPGDDDYTAVATKQWTGDVLGTVPIINNGVDEPQEWDGALARFKDLSNWTAGDYCQCIRAYKQFLIAMNVTKSGTNYPQMIKWSHSADPGAVPSTWDETDSTKDAGENNLLATNGDVVDGGTLGDSFIIYKEDATYVMRHIGGEFVFAFDELFKTSGILTQNCWQEYKGLHYVLTRGDIIAHDGNSIIPISTRRVRNYLFDQMDSTNYVKSFVTLNPKKEEVWFCFPTSGSTYVNKALVYHVIDKEWTVRNLPDVGYIGYGIVQATENTDWSDTDTWDSDSTVWDQTFYNPSIVSLLFAGTGDTALYQGDVNNTADGTNQLVSIEKTGNAHYSQRGIDDFAYKYIGAVWPRIDAEDGTQVSIYLGTQDKLDDSIDWGSAQTFTVGTDEKVDFDRSALYWGVKFETQADVSWKLQGYDVEATLQGRYG